MKKMSFSLRGSLAVLVTLLVLTGCNQGDESGEQAQGGEEPPPRPVEVMEMARQDIPLDKSYPAMLRSDDEVTLVARVSGFLEERHYERGTFVEKGDRLFTIEPDLYEATVNEREADLQSAQAELARTNRDAERYEQLLSQDSVSRQQYDQAMADQRVAQANVAQAEAALASAHLDLEYSKVTAPVSGMIGLHQVNTGNLVTDGTELATITPLDPLEVRFQLPQRDAFELRQQLSENDSVSDIGANLRVPGLDDRGDTTLEGRLDFLGSRVDQSTSTVQAAAIFDNPQAAVLPGQFVRVQLEDMKRYDVLAVPEIAVTQGLMGPQVFVLDENDEARARTVKLGEVAGPWQIIREGLDEGDRVVVGDPAGIEPGTAIDPQSFDGDAGAVVEDAEEEQAQEEAEDQEQAQQALEGGESGGSDATDDSGGDEGAEDE
ncbi:efflux RND transporter periplasmic adaptor subunit [Aidingimonas halophila]|uniref:Membrane fusion protein, multidrug efflux system n=1 Tax=Aidingimonas halophila TaxID=574349 RepID=A0A1H3EI99_9GAMM|nr:efflux RND transporter periplasmic adaptor subunit [Aidingimonas halophila]GHC33428.1 MexE family multidrug efflux RND transporter periplasmic adaptor subunit [Aidingimonas halophila]SDX77644.1 membrane fusion protein, multidrug efflux system [Aidingimonas halophila]